MNYRKTTILAEEDLGAAGTKTIDINVKDIMSRINFIWRAKVVTVSVMTAPSLDAISKVELVDGSDVLFSLSGVEAQSLNYQNRKLMPYNALSLTVDDYLTNAFSIDFGRFLNDPKLALDPSKFTNLQLKITWDEDAANGSVVVNSLEINADVFDGKAVSPSGFLSAKRFYEYAMAASGHKYVDIPTDRTLRQIMIRGLSTDHGPVALYDTFKISEDNDKAVPMNIKAATHFRDIKGSFPRISEYVTYDAVVTAKTIYATVTEDTKTEINYDATAFITAQSLFAVATITGAKVALAASVDIQADHGLISGFAPHNTIPVQFGDQSNMDDWYVMTGIGSLIFDLLSSSDADSGDTTYLISEQLRKY